MKRIVIITSVMVTAAFLLARCNRPTNNIAVTQERNTMTRTKTESGLEYTIMTEGTGNSPVIGKTVTVHYTGWLNTNGEPGKKFDSSLDRGQPFSFVIGIGHVIQGWDEGVLGMKVGEKRRLFIPAKLGYGARGAGHLIPPHADLIFDVELLNV